MRSNAGSRSTSVAIVLAVGVVVVNVALVLGGGFISPPWAPLLGSQSGAYLVLEGAIETVASPDGSRIYVASLLSDRLVSYQRHPTSGLLTLEDAASHIVLDAPVDIAVDATGRDLYVASIESDSISHWEQSLPGIGAPPPGLYLGGVAPLPAVGGALDGAAAVALSSDETELWAAGLADTRLFRYARNTDGSLDPPTTYDLGIVAARDLVFDPSGSFLYISDFGGDRILVVEVTAGGPVLRWEVTNGVAGVSGLDGPYLLLISNDGDDLYATEFVGGGVTHFARGADGSLQFVAAHVVADGPLVSPVGLALTASSDRLVVSDSGASALHVFARASDGALSYLGSSETTLASTPALSGGAGLVRAGEHIYLAALQGHALSSWRMASSRDRLELQETHHHDSGAVWASVMTRTPDVSQLLTLGVRDLTRGGAGVAYSFYQRDPHSGGVSHAVTRPLDVTAINTLTDSAIAADGAHQYLTSSFEDALLFVSVSGTQLTTQGLWLDNLSGIDGLDGASDILVSPDERHVYVAGSNDQRVSRFARDPATGALTYLGASVTGTQPEHLASSFDGAHLYVVRPGAVETYARDSISGDLTFLDAMLDGVAGVQGLHDPASLLLTEDGRHLYIGSVSDGATQGAIALFQRHATSGLLTFETHYFGTSATNPPAPDVRALVLSPSGARLLIANGIDGSAVSIARDHVNGVLDPNSLVASPPGHAWSTFLVPANDRRFLYTSSGSTISTFALTDLFVDRFETGNTSRWSASTP